MESTAKSKEIHRRVMLVMGFFTAASGIAAGYLAFGGGGDLPSLMYGRLRRASPAIPPAVRRAARPVVRFRPWSKEIVQEAKTQGRLILMDLCASWARSCHVMDETTYSDPAVAQFIERNFIAVRIDADERPDLARRYLRGGWPTTALLLPSGEILDSGTFMPPKMFLAWARTVQGGFAAKRAKVLEAAQRASADRFADREPRDIRSSPGVDETLRSARQRLLAEYDPAIGGFGRGARFPRFRRIEALLLLSGQPWARDLAERAAGGALHLEDRVWGGFFRYAKGPGWDNPEHEKLLADQAEALAVFSRLDPWAARRTWDYVAAFLMDPAGGYWASQSSEVMRPDGRVVEGRYYFSLPDLKRRALGLPAVDRRIFAGPNARMARAVLESGAQLGGGAKDHAFKTLDRYWRDGVADGEVAHSLGSGFGGLLEDQVSLGEAFLAAYRAAGERRYLDRALGVARFIETKLVDARSGALFDRPALGELRDDLDRILVPESNAEAAMFFRHLAQVLEKQDPFRLALEARAAAIAHWLGAHDEALDPAQWAVIVQEEGRRR